MNTDRAGTPKSIPRLPPAAVAAIVRRALDEDVPWGDITTSTFVGANTLAVGRIVARAAGVLCGIGVAESVFQAVDAELQFAARLADGQTVASGSIVAEIRGPAGSMLTAERTALNLLQRMSGIATVTARYVRAVEGTGATIVDTRKTAPGLRVLDKYAVLCGGGSNHRFSLSDGVLVKDNHLLALGSGDESTIADALRAARRRVPHTIRIEVEVDRLDQIEAVLAGGADIVLLDNMTPAELQEAVHLVAGRAVTEASGGMTLDGVAAVARSGVDLISVGALTHSVQALDLGLDLERLPPA